MITTNMLLTAGMTKTSGENQLKKIYIIEELLSQLEFPVYMKTSALTVAADQAFVEQAL